MRRRRRYQNPNPKPRGSGRHRVWVVQYRDLEGRCRTKTVGRLSDMTESEAKLAVADLLRPINAGVSQPTTPVYAFDRFIAEVFFPLMRRKWKASTTMTDEARINKHLVGALGRRQMRSITREQLQEVLDRKAAELSDSVVKHLRWDLRSIFRLAENEGVVDRNPADSLVVPRHCRPCARPPLKLFSWIS